MDVDVSSWAEEQSKKYDVVSVGLTVHPEEHLNRLVKREEEGANHIGEEELLASIKGFSGDDAFEGLAKNSKISSLFSTDEEYKTIVSFDDGKITFKDSNQYSKFKELQNLESINTMQNQGKENKKFLEEILENGKGENDKGHSNHGKGTGRSV